MIIKIQPASSKLTSTIIYNEEKATGKEGIHDQIQVMEDVSSEEKGHVVTTRNVPEISSLENEFARLEMLNRKKRGQMKNPAFHMSINPSEDDRPLSEKEMVDYINELMERLGYKDCPYRIYKHTDIEREHYHVVSIRIGQDGKKINDSFENTRANKIGTELEDKYGYRIGRQKPEEKAETKAETEATEAAGKKVQEKGTETKPTAQEKPKDKPAYVPPFNIKSTIPKTNQVRDIHNEAMKWSFTTMEQYQALLKWRFNLMAEQYDNGMLYCGLDGQGYKKMNVPLNENELQTDCLNQIEERIRQTSMKEKKRQRERVEQVAKWCAQEARSWKEFRELTERKGVYTVISWTKDGEAFGVTWIDRATKCIWKGSETGTDLNWLKSKAAKKGWDIERYHKYDREIKERPVTVLRKETNSRLSKDSSSGSPYTRKEQTAMQKLAARMKTMSVAETTKGSTSSGEDEDEEKEELENINRL